MWKIYDSNWSGIQGKSFDMSFSDLGETSLRTIHLGQQTGTYLQTYKRSRLVKLIGTDSIEKFSTNIQGQVFQHTFSDLGETSL